MILWTKDIKIFDLRDKKEWEIYAVDWCPDGEDYGLDDEGNVERCVFCHHPDYKGDGLCRYEKCPKAMAKKTVSATRRRQNP